jgi:hypothetical protein
MSCNAYELLAVDMPFVNVYLFKSRTAFCLNRTVSEANVNLNGCKDILTMTTFEQLLKKAVEHGTDWNYHSLELAKLTDIHDREINPTSTIEPERTSKTSTIEPIRNPWWLIKAFYVPREMPQDPIIFNPAYPDVTLIVEGKSFDASRGYLSQIAPVFAAMFNGSFIENGKQEVTLNGISAKVFEVFLQAISPQHHFKPLTWSDNIEELAVLADKYQVDCLLEECVRITITNPQISVFKKLQIVEKLGNHQHISDEIIASMTKSDFDEFDESLVSDETVRKSFRHFKGLCDETVRKCDETVRSDETVRKAFRHFKRL